MRFLFCHDARTRYFLLNLWMKTLKNNLHSECHLRLMFYMKRERKQRVKYARGSHLRSCCARWNMLRSDGRWASLNFPRMMNVTHQEFDIAYNRKMWARCAIVGPYLRISSDSLHYLALGTLRNTSRIISPMLDADDEISQSSRQQLFSLLPITVVSIFFYSVVLSSPSHWTTLVALTLSRANMCDYICMFKQPLCVRLSFLFYVCFSSDFVWIFSKMSREQSRAELGEKLKNREKKDLLRFGACHLYSVCTH